MTTATPLIVERAGVPFVADGGFEQLVAERHGANLSLYALESIVARLQETLHPAVHRVELYGVPPERLYVKIHSGRESWEEVWELQFEHAEVQLYKVS